MVALYRPTEWCGVQRLVRKRRASRWSTEARVRRLQGFRRQPGEVSACRWGHVRHTTSPRACSAEGAEVARLQN